MTSCNGTLYDPLLILLVVDVDCADAVLDVPGDVADDTRVHRHHTRAPVGVARELAEHAVRRRDVLTYPEAQFNIKNVGSSCSINFIMQGTKNDIQVTEMSEP